MKLFSLISLLTPALAQYSDSDRCGSQNNGLMCDPQGQIGQCCSQYGYCGSSTAHCSKDNGCQSGCTQNPPPPPVAPLPSCGDGFCDGRTETCSSCPTDCKCELEYLDKCLTPGHISLTFDDGPDQFAPNLLSIANKLNVKLTLFVIGEKLANTTYQKYLKQYYAAGHTIASHTFTHPFLTKLTDDQIRDEMIKTDNAIFNLIGVRPIFMRNPYADSNERTMALLDSMGYKSIFTSLDTEDTVYGDSNPAMILKNAIKGLKADPKVASHVITQHETYNVSINYLPQIVNEIKKQKYSIVPIHKCFNTKGVYRNDRCGDGKCSGYLENCQTCPKDCGSCPVTACKPV
ncbi:hypothetical protein DSO57_1010014 [Entomophthora muscae]|uniref:Uncharacterized protein n=1 Tax=Entomophthora muscae TaxID=34485 RepID=A0ACC2S8F4_9FUNG|nr:hypothetical protein DSO57_1010014 [Entomophthora muscae]